MIQRTTGNEAARRSPLTAWGLALLCCWLGMAGTVWAGSFSMKDQGLMYDHPGEWEMASPHLINEMKDSIANPQGHFGPYTPQTSFDFRLQLWLLPGHVGGSEYSFDGFSWDGVISVLTSPEVDRNFGEIFNEDEFGAWVFNNLQLYQEEVESHFSITGGKRELWLESYTEDENGDVSSRSYMHYKELDNGGSIAIHYRDKDAQFKSMLGAVKNIPKTLRPYEGSMGFLSVVVIALCVIGGLLAFAAVAARRKERNLGEASVESLVAASSAIPSPSIAPPMQAPFPQAPTGPDAAPTPLPAPAPPAAPKVQPHPRLTNVTATDATPVVDALFGGPKKKKTDVAVKQEAPAPPAEPPPVASVAAEAPATGVAEPPPLEAAPAQDEELSSYRSKKGPPPAIPMLSKHADAASAPVAEAPVAQGAPKAAPTGGEVTEGDIDPSQTLCPSGVEGATQEFPPADSAMTFETDIDPALSLCPDGIENAGAEFAPAESSMSFESDIDPALALCPEGIEGAAQAFPAAESSMTTESDIDPALALCPNGIENAGAEFPPAESSMSTESDIDPALSLCPEGVEGAREAYPPAAASDTQETDIDPALSLCPAGVENAAAEFPPAR